MDRRQYRKPTLLIAESVIQTMSNTKLPVDSELVIGLARKASAVYNPFDLNTLSSTVVFFNRSQYYNHFSEPLTATTLLGDTNSRQREGRGSLNTRGP